MEINSLSLFLVYLKQFSETTQFIDGMFERNYYECACFHSFTNTLWEHYSYEWQQI